MDSPGSVTCWLDGLRLGDDAAAQRLWEGYFTRLVGMARRKLRGHAPRGADEEDVALSAFHSFCKGAEEGRFPRLADRNDLWQILVMIAARKAANLLRRENAAKRGGAAHGGEPLSAVVGPGPTPSFAAQVTEEYLQLLGLLDGDLRAVALLKMQGLTDAQVAAACGRSLATVERKLRRVRRIWDAERGAGDAG
jgi:DNA-directed RNA polymerase specialized sigma24 family protein